MWTIRERRWGPGWAGYRVSRVLTCQALASKRLCIWGVVSRKEEAAAGGEARGQRAEDWRPGSFHCMSWTRRCTRLCQQGGAREQRLCGERGQDAAWGPRFRAARSQGGGGSAGSVAQADVSVTWRPCVQARCVPKPDQEQGALARVPSSETCPSTSSQKSPQGLSSPPPRPEPQQPWLQHPPPGSFSPPTHPGGLPQGTRSAHRSGREGPRT